MPVYHMSALQNIICSEWIGMALSIRNLFLTIIGEHNMIQSSGSNATTLMFYT